MDFSGQYQFAGSQPYQGGFMAMPPLTPSHSQSASDDYNANNTSPPEGFESLAHGDQFQQFDYTHNLNAQHHPQPSAVPGPPTPPFAQRQQQQQQQQQQHLQAPNHHHHQPPSRNGSIHSGSGTGADVLSLGNGSTHPQGDSFNGEDAQVGRGGSEDDDSMTPAQSRRKAQNRAAQRAFRERKEKHVKDLEAKLANLEAAQEQASVENERLKRDLQKMSTENEILRATTTSSRSSHSPPSATVAAAAAQHTGPMEYQPTDFYSNVLQNHTNKVPSHRIVTSDDGERLFAAGATWDYIISHELYKRGLVDVGGVSERLKNCARCDGQGPVFPEGAIIRAIEHSVASGSDDLL